MNIRLARAAARERSSSYSEAQEVPWPLPIRGLFDDASNADISGAYAVVLSNWRSNGLSLEMRDGFDFFDENEYRQRIPYDFGATPRYLGVSDTTITDGPNTFSRTFDDEISYTHISAYALMVDGQGPCINYNVDVGFADAGYTTDTGKNVDDFNGVFSHQDRAYFWDTNDPDFYYGDVGAVTGELERFPISRLGNITGNIALITSMTFNAMHGMNDVLVVMTTTGWVILYEGLDPGDANDWRLLGRIKVAAPVSRFAVHSFGSELWILTKRGLVSIQDTLQNGKLALGSSVGSSITDLINVDIAENIGRPGWGMITRADGTQLLLGVPIENGFKQYVFDAEAKAWSTSDYPAQRWSELEGVTGFNDPDGRFCNFNKTIGDNGENITAIFHTAWFRLRRHSELAYIIPTIIADGDLEVKITVLVDNNETDGDIAQAEQIVTLRPDNPGDRVALDEIISVGAAGRVFQARFEITGKNVVFRSLVAGLA